MDTLQELRRPRQHMGARLIRGKCTRVRVVKEGALEAAADNALVTCIHGKSTLDLSYQTPPVMQFKLTYMGAFASCDWSGQSPVTLIERQTKKYPGPWPCPARAAGKQLFISIHREQPPSSSSRTSSHNPSVFPPPFSIIRYSVFVVVFCNQDDLLWPMRDHHSGVSTKLIQQRHQESYPDEDEEAHKQPRNEDSVVENGDDGADEHNDQGND